MKYLLLTGLSILLGAKVIAQTGSVELKSGATTVGQYSSVTEAYAAIPASLTQPYIIEFKSTYTGANETYPITFVSKSGASAVNTITLRPAAGVTSLIMSASVTSSSSAILVLNDADYVVIDGRPNGIGISSVLTINNTATGSNTVQLINGACNNTIRNVTLQNGGASSVSRAVFLSTSASNTSGNSDNVFSNIIISGSRYGINTNGTTANPNTNNTIYGCQFQNVVFTGIWYQAGTGKLTVDSCRFTTTAASSTTPYALLCDSQTDTLILTKNTVVGLQASGSSGIRGFYIRTTSGTSYSYIANNFITLAAANNSTSIIGIAYEGSANTTAAIYHNAVYIGGTLASGGSSGSVVSAALVKTHSGTGDEFVIKNNIFVNERTGGATGVQHPAMALTNTAGSFTMDANTYNATGGMLLRYGTTTYADITTWQTAMAPNEQTANSAIVAFVNSSADLHLTGTSIGNTLLGANPIPGITVDADNQLRNGVKVYRGADEIPSAPLPVSLLHFAAQLAGNKVVVQWKTASEWNNKGFAILRSTDGQNFTKIGYVNSVGNSNTVITYSFTDAGLPATETWYYQLEGEDVDGRTKRSAIVMVQQKAAAPFAAIFPNPAIGSFNVRIQAASNAVASVSISNISGTVLLQRQVQLVAGTNLVPFENEGVLLPPGNYYITVGTAQQRSILPFVKTK